jgi:hypothetical protein
MITKSWIDTLEFDPADCLYPRISSVDEEQIYAIAYQGTDNDGYIKTMSISADGTIGNAIIDSLEFDSADCQYFPTTLHIAGDYYLIAYAGTDTGGGSTYDGWSCTITIKS